MVDQYEQHTPSLGPKVMKVATGRRLFMAAIMCCPVAAIPSPMSCLRLRGGGVALVRTYLELCALYGTRPHPSVLVALRWDLVHLHPARSKTVRSFRDHDMLPLVDLLLLPAASHITSLSLRGCALRSTAGATLIARLVALHPTLVSLDVTGNKLGPEAGELLAESLSASRSLKHLRLRGCRLRSGADALALALATRPPHEFAPLRTLDLSNNHMGFRSKSGLERVNGHRSLPIALNLDGNLLLTEALNVATHGSGAVAAVFGGAMLLRSVVCVPLLTQTSPYSSYRASMHPPRYMLRYLLASRVLCMPLRWSHAIAPRRSFTRRSCSAQHGTASRSLGPHLESDSETCIEDWC